LPIAGIEFQCPHEELCRLGLLQIERVEAFGEPTVHWGEQSVGFCLLVLVAPQPRHAHRCAQFPGLCLLGSRDRERTCEIGFRFRRIRLRRLERDFAGHPMDLGLMPPFLGCFYRCHRFANAFAATAIFGRSSFPPLFTRLKKRPEPPEAKHGRVYWRVQPRDRRERSQVLLLQPIPIGGPTNPRHTTKHSKIRDVDFIALAHITPMRMVRAVERTILRNH
jgi:hypothetical protein